MIPRAVPPSVRLIERDEVREKLARPLLALCELYGPARVARNLGGLDRDTISDARDEKTTLSLENALNLLILDTQALNPLLAHFGLKAVPKDCCSNGNNHQALTAIRDQLSDLIDAAAVAGEVR